MLGEQLRERGSDVLEDLAGVVVGERGQDAYVGDEELILVAGARAVVRNILQTAHRKPCERRIALEQRFDRRWNGLFHGSSVRGFGFASGPAPRARAAQVHSCRGVATFSTYAARARGAG